MAIHAPSRRSRGFPGVIYPNLNPPPARFGTARRDAYGNLLHSEYDEHGMPLGTASGGLQAGRSPREQAEADAHWAKFFPGVPLATGRASAPADNGAPMQGPTRTGQTVDSSAKAPQQGPTRTGATADDTGPKMGDTRTNAFGGTETLVASQGGPRWVGSTIGAPRATNFRPGDAGTNSLADHVTVQANTADAVNPRATGRETAGDWKAIQDKNSALYRPGGALKPVGGGYPGVSIPETYTPAPGDSTHIAEAYGDKTGGKIVQATPGEKLPPARVTANGVVRDMPSWVAGAPGVTAPTPPPTSGMGMGDRQMADASSAPAPAVPPSTPATATGIASMNGEQGWDLGKSAASGVGNVAGAAMGNKTASERMGDALRGAVQSVRNVLSPTPPDFSPAGQPGGRFGGTGGVTAPLPSAPENVYQTARGIGAATGMQSGDPTGRTAFGTPITPLKSAVATMDDVMKSQPKRKDLVQTANSGGSDY